MDLVKDFWRRFWWAIIGIVIAAVAVLFVLNYYQRLVTVSGYRVSPEAAKAVEYYQTGDLAKAEAQYKLVVKKHPRDWFSWNGLANVYRDENMLQLAEGAYLKALAINPKFEQAYRNIFGLYYAWAATDPTQLAKAEPILLRGLQLMPKSQNILEDIVNYYAKTGDQQKLQQYRAMLEAIRSSQPKTQPNSNLGPQVYQ